MFLCFPSSPLPYNFHSLLLYFESSSSLSSSSEGRTIWRALSEQHQALSAVRTVQYSTVRYCSTAADYIQYRPSLSSTSAVVVSLSFLRSIITAEVLRMTRSTHTVDPHLTAPSPLHRNIFSQLATTPSCDRRPHFSVALRSIQSHSCPPTNHPTSSHTSLFLIHTKPTMDAPLSSPSAPSQHQHPYFTRSSSSSSSCSSSQSSSGPTSEPQQQPAQPQSQPAPQQRTADTSAFLRDFNLVAEAAKRAQMAVLMRDLEGVAI